MSTSPPRGGKLYSRQYSLFKIYYHIVNALNIRLPLWERRELHILKSEEGSELLLLASRDRTRRIKKCYYLLLYISYHLELLNWFETSSF